MEREGRKARVFFHQLFESNKSSSTSKGKKVRRNKAKKRIFKFLLDYSIETYSSFFPLSSSSLRKLLEIKLLFPRKKRVKVICIIANSREFYTSPPLLVCLSADNSRLNKHSG